MAKELHLFILWENARFIQSRILSDIKLHFSIYQVFEIKWTEDLVASNFSRFYGTNLPANCDKEQDCGRGSFLLVVVEDSNPIYELRLTSHGREIVNINTFDRKQIYRSWTGGGSKIHGTNNTKETNHNLTLLLGCNTNDFLQRYKSTDEIICINQDVIGAKGWESIKQILYVLNNTIESYVVMRGSEYLTSNYFSEQHRDIDILTDRYDDIHFIINGMPCCNDYRPHFLLNIENVDLYFDVWNSDNNYFDVIWTKKMLNNKVLHQDVYVLNEENNFYCLLYHCLIHKGSIEQQYLNYLEEYKTRNLSNKKDLTWAEILIDYLKKNSYDISVPNDKSIHIHTGNKYISDFYKSNGILLKQLYIVCDNQIFYSKVLEKDNSYIKKGTASLIDNEALFLKQLNGYSYFPQLLDYKTDSSEHVIEISRKNGLKWDVFFRKKHNNNKDTIYNTIKQLLDILRILNKENIIHRDFMPSNILIDKKGNLIQVSLIDFGWATDTIHQFTCVTPEGLGGIYAKAEGHNDLYSVAMLLQETWPNLIFVKKICSDLKRGIIPSDEIKIPITDFFRLLLLRYKRLNKIFKRVKRFIRNFNNH